jgi:hypothetical protein
MSSLDDEDDADDVDAAPVLHAQTGIADEVSVRRPLQCRIGFSAVSSRRHGLTPPTLEKPLAPAN